MNRNWKQHVVIGAFFCLFIIFFFFLKFNCNENKKQEETKDNNSVYKWEVGTFSKESPAYTLKRKKIKNYGALYKSFIKKDGIFLTFDTGYDVGYVEEILDTLENNNVKAAFFVTHEFLSHSPSLVERMIEDGHIVGNHTENHYDMTKLSEQEIKDEILSVHNQIYEMFGYRMEYFRPPSGIFNEKVLEVSQELGYKVVLWEFAYDDWNENREMEITKAKNELYKNVSDGDVVLLHATSRVNATILDDIIKEFSKRRYKFYTLDEYE